MYSFFTQGKRSYIAVASLEPRKRIIIPLTNGQLTEKDFSGNIKVVLRHDGKVEVHRSIHCKVSLPQHTQDKTKLNVSAVDKGFTDLLHSSTGKKYGMGYGAKMALWSDDLQSIHSGRARMHALVKRYKKQLADLSTLPINETTERRRRKLTQQIATIQKNNLGSLKVQKRRERIKNQIQTEIGTAVNQFFKAEKPDVLAVERLDFEGSYHFGKRINRLLKTWHKGILQAELVKGSKKNGVLLEEVHAAYSSQLCRNCGAVDAKNRKAEQFACICCGYKEDANFNASLNLRERVFDPEIGPYMPYKQVKEILLKRHRLLLYNLDLNEKGSSSSANHLNL
jgi:putative transposase